jgi:hypothetical protein
MSIVDDILNAHSKRDGASETMDTYGSIKFLGDGETIERRFRKTCWLVGTFDDLRIIHNGKWEVKNRHGTIRRLVYEKDEVRIEGGDGEEIIIPSKTKIFYEPWDFDRRTSKIDDGV